MSSTSIFARTARPALSLVGAGVLLVCGTLASTGAHAAVTFTLNFNVAGQEVTGFNDATDGAARRAAADTAASMFGQLFSSHFNYNANIVLDATATNNPNSTNLASAGSDLFNGATEGFTVNERVKTNILGNVVNPVGSQGFVNVNFGQFWQLDPNAGASSFAPNQYDFFSTMIHEFTHAVGFSSLINQDGSATLGGKNWASFDQYVADGAGALIDSNFDMNTSRWSTASVGGTSPADGLFFVGPNAMQANGGAPVGLYSPTVWQEGSSGSHLDTDNPTFASMLMKHATPDGLGPRTFSAIEVGMLKDIGYVNAVPEPTTYALMLAGLAVVGGFARKRRVAGKA